MLTFKIISNGYNFTMDSSGFAARGGEDWSLEIQIFTPSPLRHDESDCAVLAISSHPGETMQIASAFQQQGEIDRPIDLQRLQGIELVRPVEGVDFL